MNRKTLKRIAAVAMAATLAAAPLAAMAQGNHRLLKQTQTEANSNTKIEQPAAVKAGEIWDGSTAAGFAGGTGTQNDPYIISNGAELAYLAQEVNSGDPFEGKYLKLTSDIYLNDTENWENWANGVIPNNEWTAIGDKDHAFHGTFDGNNASIYGIYINVKNDCAGLFGNAMNCTLSNINVSMSYISGRNSIGGIIGYAVAAKISGCHNTGNVNGESDIGGIAGTATTCTINDCNNSDNTINGEEHVGGIVGVYTNGDRTLSNCQNRGVINGGDHTGGICGYASDVIITGCSNVGSIYGYDDVGGIVGSQYSDCAVSVCFNAASVIGQKNIGGISGYAGDGNVTNCYNTGLISANYNGGSVAGDISAYSSMAMCYGINGGQSIGSKFSHSQSNCYILDTSCGGSDQYATVLTDEQMRDASSFEGFDFNEVWTMDGNPNYPYPEFIGMPYEGDFVDTHPTPAPTATPTPTVTPSDTHTPTATPSDTPTPTPTPTATPSPTPGIYDEPGDIDGDGNITVSDALTAIRNAMALQDLTPEQIACADLDGDGIITTADALMIIRIAMGIVTP